MRVQVGLPVAIVHWPREAAHRATLAEAGLPRLLVVEPGVPPPEVADDEDWIRAPADERDLAARLAGLRARCAAAHLDGGRLETTRGTVTLSPAEAAVTEVLLGAEGRVVARGALADAAAPHLAVTSRTVDDVVYRLRRRLRPVGLDVFVARGRGFTLGPRLDWPAEGITLA